MVYGFTQRPVVGQFRFDLNRNAAFSGVFPISVPAIGDFHVDDGLDGTADSGVLSCAPCYCCVLNFSKRAGCDQGGKQDDGFHASKDEADGIFGKRSIFGNGGVLRIKLFLIGVNAYLSICA